MDPICHTLVGAALSKGGLDRWSPRATAVLIIAANAPDLDFVATFVGRNLAWRRGITHGVPALLIWPFVIAALAMAFDRWRHPAAPARARFGPLVVISAIGVITHPFLDYLNNYGMRWLMPIRNQWFYGDSLFIVDPWLYLILGLGLWFARRNHRTGQPDPRRPVRVALALAAIYVGLMIAGTAAGRVLALRTLGRADPARVMVTAMPVTPFRRQLIADGGGDFQVGTVDLLRRRVQIDSVIPRSPRHEEAVVALRRTAVGRGLIAWSRFPVVRRLEDGGLRFFDLRYSDGRLPSWASLDVSPQGDVIAASSGSH